MNIPDLAVKFYKDVPKEEKRTGIPDAWPAHVVELHEGVPVPEGYEVMSHQDYLDHLEFYQGSHDAWHEKHQPNAFWRSERSFVAACKRLWHSLRGTL